MFAVPAGMEHDFINTGTEDMKLFTVYSPPEHPDGVVHATKAMLSLIRKSNYSVERGRSILRVNGAT
jgi:oxalate decarboxylase/phosphoglucose isomerase-like protein (cupin superfamily)